MKLKNMTQVELELLSYTDLAELVLEENKKTMSTAEIFRIICKLLNYGDEKYANKIGDFYTSLTTDKRFILLEDAKWDLKKNHIIPLVVDEDEEEIIEEEIEDEEEIETVEEKLEIEDDDSIDGIIDDDVELSDLTIVDEEDLDS